MNNFMVLQRGELRCYVTIQLSEENRYEVMTVMITGLLQIHAKAGRDSKASQQEEEEALTKRSTKGEGRRTKDEGRIPNLINHPLDVVNSEKRNSVTVGDDILGVNLRGSRLLY